MAPVQPDGVDADRAEGREPVATAGPGWRWRCSGVVLVLALTQPWWLAPALSRYLSASAGRSVHFDSAVILALGRRRAGRLRLRGVRIDNAPWARDEASVRHLRPAEFQLSGRRSEGRWIISRVRLGDGEVHLERTVDGLRNWRLRNPEHRGPGRFWFTVLEAERTTLSFLHPGADLELRASARAVRCSAVR